MQILETTIWGRALIAVFILSSLTLFFYALTQDR